MLIQQAGMMPADLEGRDVEYYDISDPAFIFARHHWWFYKISILLKDLILLGRLHNKYTYLEPYKPAFYREAMGSMKAGFIKGQCPDTWSPADKREYYGRLYDMIKEWETSREITQTWFKININQNPRSLEYLIDRGLIDEPFVTGIIQTLEENIDSNSGFEFDPSY